MSKLSWVSSQHESLLFAVVFKIPFLNPPERSRQSARECRARKKLRYQYLEELVADREKAVIELRRELEKYTGWIADLDAGRIPDGLQEVLEEVGALKPE